MKRRGVLGGLAVLLAGGCGMKPMLPDYRYRLTVEVETPQGLRTGSSVIQVSSQVASQYALMPGKVTTRVTGEAVAVDLPNGKVLFALLSKPTVVDGADAYAFDALMPRPWAGSEEYVRDLNVLVKRRDVGVLKPKDYPMLVTFGDINDPTTVERVNLEQIPSKFGHGILLRRIAVQITTDPVTKLVAKKLPWITNIYSMGISSDFQPQGIPMGNFRGLFTTENFQ